jgi:acyl-CoA thioesterase
MTPQERADRVREGLWANDWASQGLGMQIVAMTPGHCTMQMTVRKDMLNGHGIGHGGFITTLADSAFAFACNSHDEMTVAAGFKVDILAPAQLGDVLTATATEVQRGGRLGIYDVVVVNQKGERIAMFRGNSYTMKGRSAIKGTD